MGGLGRGERDACVKAGIAEEIYAMADGDENAGDANEMNDAGECQSGNLPMGDPANVVGLKDLPKPAQHVVQNGIQVIGQTTILVTNANSLVESTGEKFKVFHAMIKNLDPKPDIIVVQELGGYSGGKEKIRTNLKGALRMYDCVYTQKPLMDAGDHRAGAGVMILFKRELFRGDVIRLPSTVEKPMLLDGHIRTVCLWWKQQPHMPPIVLTSAYIPPIRSGVHAKYCQEIRSEGLAAIPKIVDHVNKIRRGCQQIIVAHINAGDGCIELKTTLAESVSMGHRAELDPDSTTVMPMTMGMNFYRTPEGEVVHRRNKIKSISKATLSGKALSRSLAEKGYLPIMGVSEPLRPSTWRLCKGNLPRCAWVCKCDRSRMTGQNDMIYVSQESLWSGYKTKLMKSTVKKIVWHPTIDHSVVRTTIPIFGVLQEVAPIVNRRKVNGRRFKPPVELLRKAIFLRTIRDQMDDAMMKGASSVHTAWSKVDECYKTTHKVDNMTPQELSAASVNAPKGFWDHFGAIQQEPGFINSISSGVLLELIVDENDGSVITADGTKTADLILQHRRKMAQIPRVLPVPDHVIYEALRSVQTHNRSVEDLSCESTAFKLGKVPDLLWRKTEERRYGVQHAQLSPADPQRPERARLSGYDQWMSQREDVEHTMAAYNLMRNKHQQACASLNVPITYHEVNEALLKLKLKDVGAGPDDLPPIVLSTHADHGPQCPVAQALVRDFNDIFKSGVAPKDWQNYRMLLHHKGHGAHPAALDSYRALGIGNCLMKTMSMVLEERLNTFLTVTGALSREQMGFRRKSGTSEAVLALSEVVRSAAKEGPVLTAFVDVRAAYDSVIREVLYAKMLRMGIGGNFLTTIQEFYHAPTAELEVGGYSIGTVPMELGLAQGSPLSPTLFNIYIDSCIRELSENAHMKSVQENVRYGLFLPSARGDQQTNSMVSLWYADDSVILETDIERLQWLANELVRLLAGIGLTVNVRKTKLMVTAGREQSMESLKQFVDNIEFHMSGQIVEIVSEFSYLGVLLNSRGNWENAWSKAYKIASLKFHQAVLGGIFINSGTMAEMTKFVKAKIWSQMDGIMAVVGAGGCKTSAFHNIADKCVHKVLKQIVGHWSLNPQALRVESGVWDTVTRIDMLVLRFFTKICSSDPDSVVSRVIRMSMANLSTEEYEKPDEKWSNVSYVHRQSWVQRALASAERLGISKVQMCRMDTGILLIIQEQRQNVQGEDVWVTVPSPTTYIPTWKEREVSNVRLALKEKPVKEYVEGEDAWTVLPYDIVFGGTLLGQLSEPLRLAYHAAIRKQANKRRRYLVKVFAKSLIEQDHHLKGWALMCGFFSFMPPYWNIHDVAASRAMLRIRLDVAWNEGAMRMKLIQSKRSWKHDKGCFERIEDKRLRACYLCDAIYGQPGIFESESLYHMLIECPHQMLRTWRNDLRKAITDLSKEFQVQGPTFNRESELWAVMLLCTSTDSFSGQPQPAPRLVRPLVRPPSVNDVKDAEEIRSRNPIHDREAIVEVVKWMQPLTSAWVGILREHRRVGAAEGMHGAKLTELVCRYMRKLFTLHRNLLNGNHEYRGRKRDPPLDPAVAPA